MSNSALLQSFNDRNSWLESRRQGVGASDAAAILGISPWKSPLGLFTEKLGLIEPSEAETEAQSWGLLLEGPIAARYERETKRVVVRHDGRYDIQIHPEYPFLRATLDAHVVFNQDELIEAKRNAPGVLEIKTAAFFKHDEWQDEPPLYYQVQVQHQLAVTGLRWASLAVLIGGQTFLWMDIERNERFIAVLIEQERAFWDRVTRQEPPPPDASESCRELLRQLYPKEVPVKTVSLPAEAIEWDQQRCEAITELKKWEAVKNLAENNLKAAIGDAECGRVTPDLAYTWKYGKRASYTVPETETRMLRRREGG